MNSCLRGGSVMFLGLFSLALALAGAAPAKPGRYFHRRSGPAPIVSTSPSGSPCGYQDVATARNYEAPAWRWLARRLAVADSEFAAQEQRSTGAARGFIIVQAPATDAKVWINDKLMTQAGLERAFVTPQLSSTARAYSFDIKTGWTDNLGPRTQQTTVQVRAGESRTVVFPLAPN